MAIFDNETGERLDGPNGKWAKEPKAEAPKAEKAEEKSTEAPAKAPASKKES